MTIDEYQIEASNTVLDKSNNLEYLTLGLSSEAGEVASVVKKYIRGDYGIRELRELLHDECGDALWYLSQILEFLDLELSSVAESNIAKLQDRKARGVLRGNGNR